MTVSRLLGVAVLAAASVLFVGFAPPQPSTAGDDEILLGMSTALTGPAAQLGINMRNGINAAFEEANASGGIHGRKLRLIALDDGYEPERTAPNMHELIKRRDVVAVVGNVGTPTAVAAIPIANETRTLLFGAYTGAGALRKSPPDRYVINYRASYAEETAAMVEALVNDARIGVDEIAFFTQRDAYGDAGYIGGITAMKRFGLKKDLWVAHGRYERNTTAVENALADILGARKRVKAVIMVGAYEPTAEFIRLAREVDFHPLFLSVSFVGAEPLAKALGKAGDGVIVTQVVPHFDADLPIATAFRAALREFDAKVKPTFGSFEGYIVGRIFLRALNNIRGKPTRKSVIKALDGLGEFDIGLNASLELNEQDHQACHGVWPTVIRDGKLVPFDWRDLRRLQSGG